MVTTSTLLRWRRVDPQDPAGFKKAYAVANTEFANFLPVVNGLNAGVVWSGAGQPEAAKVATDNSYALEIARIQMDAGAVAATALVTAMNALRTNMAGLVEHARSRNWRITENGDVEQPEEDPDYNPREVQHLRLAAQQTLKLASAADLAAQGSFTKVTQGTPPVISDTATDGNANAAAVDQALEDRAAIQQVSAPWLIIGDEAMISVDDITTFLETGVAPQDVKGRLGLLDEVLARFGDYALGKIPNASTAIAALKGDLTAVFSDALTLAVETGVTASGSEVLARVFTRASTAVGLTLLAKDLALALWKNFSTPDAPPDRWDVVDLNGNVITTVGDPDLERLAHRYYLPEGNADPGDDVRDSIAQIVHKERADGSQGADNARIQEAQRLRADLLRWMASHDASEADQAYAYSLVLELDFALGNPPTP